MTGYRNNINIYRKSDALLCVGRRLKVENTIRRLCDLSDERNVKDRRIPKCYEYCLPVKQAECFISFLRTRKMRFWNLCNKLCFVTNDDLIRLIIEVWYRFVSKIYAYSSEHVTPADILLTIQKSLKCLPSAVRSTLNWNSNEKCPGTIDSYEKQQEAAPWKLFFWKNRHFQYLCNLSYVYLSRVEPRFVFSEYIYRTTDTHLDYASKVLNMVADADRSLTVKQLIKLSKDLKDLVETKETDMPLNIFCFMPETSASTSRGKELGDVGYTQEELLIYDELMYNTLCFVESTTFLYDDHLEWSPEPEEETLFVSPLVSDVEEFVEDQVRVSR